VKRKIFRVLFALVLVVSFSLVTAVPVSAANLVVTAGTSVEIDADTNGGAYTSLTNISFTDPTPDLAATNTFYLTAPTGFEFDPLAAADQAIGAGYGGLQIDLGGGAGAAQAPLYTTNDTIATWTVTAAGTVSAGSITISGMEIRPTTATTTISGDGTAMITIASPEQTFDTPNAHPIDHVPGVQAAYTVVTQNTGTEVAGVGFSITLSAVDQYGNVNDDGTNLVTGAVSITWTSNATNAPDGAAPTPIADGNQTFSLGAVTTGTDWTLTNAGETPTITATSAGPLTGTSAAITVQHAAAANLRVTGTATMTAGTTNQLTITAYDAYGNVADGANGATEYTGDKTITLSGPSAAPDGTVPTVTDKTAGAVNIGTGTTITFASGASTAGGLLTAYKAEGTTVDVDDTSINSSANVTWDLDLTVNPDAFAEYTVVEASTSQVAGTAFTANITAVDEFQNLSPSGITDGTLNGYTYAFTGPGDAPDSTAPTYPTTANFSSGWWNPSVTLVKAESIALTVTDNQTSPMSGISASITVAPDVAVILTVTGITDPITKGVASDVIVTAKDTYENTATGYTGTVTLTSTDSAATLAGDSTLTSGTKTFSGGVAFGTVGQHSVTATDTANATITGTQSGIGVYDKLISLNADAWTLISTDDYIISSSGNTSVWEGTVTLKYRYTGSSFVSATFADLEPVEAFYVKTTGSGVKAGLNFSTAGSPGASTKDLVAGWNLVSSANQTDAGAVLSPLRYVAGLEAVALATLVSQNSYNLNTGDWYIDATTWSNVTGIMNPFDGYWVYMNADKSFGVIPQ